MPAFALAPIALDIAEYELVERERESQGDQSLPPAQSAPQGTQAPVAANDYHHAEDWLRELVQLRTGGTLAELVPQEGFAVSAYRMSLLGLIGDPGAENRNGVSAEMAQLPLQWRVEPVFEPVERCGVAYMSRSRLEPRGVVSGEAGRSRRSRSRSPCRHPRRRRGSSDVDSGNAQPPSGKQKPRRWIYPAFAGIEQKPSGQTQSKRNNTRKTASKTTEPA